MKRKTLSVTAFLLSVILLMSSCAGCAKKKDSESDKNTDIVDLIENYEKSVKKLSVDDLKNYTDASSFQDLDLDSDETEIISALLKRAKLETTETKEKKEDTASATIKVTYVDLEEVLHQFDGQADKKSIIDVIGNAKTKKASVKVSLEKDGDEWRITDDSSIYDLLLHGQDDLSYYLHPLEPTETELTTTSEEPTTMATSEESSSEGSSSEESNPGSMNQDTPTPTPKPTPTPAPTPTPEDTPEPKPKPGNEKLNTQPRPAEKDAHLKSPSEIDKYFKDNGFKAQTDDLDGYKATYYSYNPDDIFLYVIEFDSKETADKLSQVIIDEVVYENLKMQNGTVTDSWQGNTHNIYSVHRQGDDHNYDLYIYQKDTLLVFGAYDEYPNADLCVDYLIWFEEIGLWKF